MLFLILLLIGSTAGISRGQDLFLKHYGVDHGLPSNEIYRIREDRAGHLLIASDRGAARFDGYSFETLYINNPETVTPVYDIYPAPSGKVYFPGLEGHIYVYQNGRLAAHPYNKKIAAADAGSGLLIAELIREQRDGLLIKYNIDSSLLSVSADGRVSRRIPAGGFYFDLRSGSFFKAVDRHQAEHSVQPLFITWSDGARHTDSVRLSWRTGYVRHPMYCRLRGTDIFCVGRHVLLYRNRKPAGRYLLPKTPLSFDTLPSGALAVGFESGGAALYSLQGDSIIGPHRSFLAPLSVTGIHADFQGGYWFSTLENGLFYAYPAMASLQRSHSRIVFMIGRGDTVYVVHQDSDIHRYASGRLIDTLRGPVRQGQVLLSASFSRAGELIMNSYDSFYYLRGARWRAYAGRDRLLVEPDRSIAYGAGVAEPKLHKYRMPDGLLLGSIAVPKRIVSLEPDNADGLWVGTMEGLYHYSGQRGLTFRGTTAPALQDRIVSIKHLADGALAVATLSRGIVILRNNAVQVINTGNGLVSPIINGMSVDGNTIWLGTNKGLTELTVRADGVRSRHYNTDDGLPTLDIQAFAVSNGWLYLKWLYNTATMDLRLLRNHRASRGAYITGVFLNGSRVADSARAFRHSNNDLLVTFSSINFASGSRQQYRYRLSGFEQAWRTTYGRQATYTNLPPGQYSFMVQVESYLGDYATKPAVYRFSILPPFWHRWWFIALAMLGCAAALLALFRLRLKAVQRKNDLLIELADYQQKALTQLISPHFIFNILNTAQSFILREDKLAAASFISRIARLLRLALEVGGERYITLEKEVDLLTKYTELEVSRVERKFSCRIDIDEGIDTASTTIPGMLVQPFVENAIKHGMMHLRSGKGLIRIRFSLQEKSLLCAIQDNGVGRERARAINPGTDADHKSLGIEITRRRLMLLHRQHRSGFIFDITDLHDDNGMPAGTLVVFSIPYTKNHEPV